MRHNEHAWCGVGRAPSPAAFDSEAFMTRKSFLTLGLLALLLPAWAVAQSDTPEPSLGDLARQYRKAKAAVEHAVMDHAVIDNDNLHKVMDEVQTRKLRRRTGRRANWRSSTARPPSAETRCKFRYTTAPLGT